MSPGGGSGALIRFEWAMRRWLDLRYYRLVIHHARLWEAWVDEREAKRKKNDEEKARKTAAKP